ncbi:MAG: HIT domain-containing protein [Planctomycetes bacterium]|nr:HIT domain-containing protein [Planctomycetota bacterium]
MRKNLWAPWRLDYIKGIDEQKGCFLCDAVRSPDAPDSLVVHREAEAFVILNRFPYSHGHLMVAPTGHKATLDELADGEMLALMRLARRCSRALTKLLKAQGHNVGLNIGKAAGAGLKDHLHLHLVPRWVGDTNYMAILADVRVVSRSLQDLSGQLRDEFRRG